MALDDRTEEIERLERMIGIAEDKGEVDEPRTHRLRAELAEKKAALEVECVIELPEAEIVPLPDTVPLSALPFSAAINRRLQDRGVFEVLDLDCWTGRLLGELLKWNDVLAVRSVLSACGLGNLLGSAEELLTELPEKSPYAVDVRQGVLIEDVLRIGRMVAFKKKTQREASVLLGSSERGSAAGLHHQRWGSCFDRNSKDLAPIWLEAIEHEYGRTAWFIGASVVRIRDARRREWGLSLLSRLSKEETIKAMDDIGVLIEGRGRGRAEESWRGISVLFSCVC